MDRRRFRRPRIEGRFARVEVPMQGNPGEVTVFYLRRGPMPDELSRGLSAVAERYAPRVRLVEGSGAGASGPIIRIMRGPHLVGEAMGADLPERELERVIRSALTCR